VSGDDLADPAGYLLNFSSPTIPLRRVQADEPGWSALAIGDDPQALLLFRSEACRFRRTPRWRRILAHVLLLRALRLRSDALLFHAASLAVDGRGLLLVGPKGSGKTTVALALAARGHGLLGDETAAYLPASRELLPLRRPVGIKPGPQPLFVREYLARAAPPADADGMIRVPVQRLFGGPEPPPAPLGAVAFLAGFAAAPRVERTAAGRAELEQLQVLPTTLATAPATRRVFEMVRLLSDVVCLRLSPGDPDETALRVEEELRSAWG
jgi:hypothetical protein